MSNVEVIWSEGLERIVKTQFGIDVQRMDINALSSAKLWVSVSAEYPEIINAIKDKALLSLSEKIDLIISS